MSPMSSLIILETIAETYFIVDIIFCVINMMILFNFLESDLDSV